ncbi:hypothetical protein SAMN05216303_102813 [Rhodoferax sp. OV413]|uniref:hypothetical protein n=1 Tax=Rhodoferax sp. OV413 TaxID=1855285 RepID=UPI0008893CD2|nr:hypothetical protein [Rhodoferax sp. OV413]SDO96699.1 hypothetical protein SAMN05216303_102813 [Rhodoferax sp. OV413]
MVSKEDVNAARISWQFACGTLKFEQQALEILLQRRTELTASVCRLGFTDHQADAEFFRLLQAQSSTLVAESNALNRRSHDFREILEAYTDQFLQKFVI